MARFEQDDPMIAKVVGEYCSLPYIAACAFKARTGIDRAYEVLIKDVRAALESRPARAMRGRLPFLESCLPVVMPSCEPTRVRAARLCYRALAWPFRTLSPLIPLLCTACPRPSGPPTAVLCASLPACAQLVERLHAMSNSEDVVFPLALECTRSLRPFLRRQLIPTIEDETLFYRYVAATGPPQPPPPAPCAECHVREVCQMSSSALPPAAFARPGACTSPGQPPHCIESAEPAARSLPPVSSHRGASECNAGARLPGCRIDRQFPSPPSHCDLRAMRRAHTSNGLLT
jgi:hypothetical protein